MGIVTKTCIQVDRWTGRQEDRRTGIHGNSYKNMYTSGQVDRKTEGLEYTGIVTKTCIQVDR